MTAIFNRFQNISLVVSQQFLGVVDHLLAFKATFSKDIEQESPVKRERSNDVDARKAFENQPVVRTIAEVEWQIRQGHHLSD